MANKIKVFETKTKDKKGHTITTVHIFGSLLPEPDLKIVPDEEAKLVSLNGKTKVDDKI